MDGGGVRVRGSYVGARSRLFFILLDILLHLLDLHVLVGAGRAEKMNVTGGSGLFIGWLFAVVMV